MSIQYNSKEYGYALLGELNAYGESVIPKEPIGKIRMSISLINKATERDNILYSTATYIGITRDKVTDEYLLFDEDKKYKVLYVNADKRFNQAYLELM